MLVKRKKKKEIKNIHYIYNIFSNFSLFCFFKKVSSIWKESRGIWICFKARKRKKKREHNRVGNEPRIVAKLRFAIKELFVAILLEPTFKEKSKISLLYKT